MYRSFLGRTSFHGLGHCSTTAGLFSAHEHIQKSDIKDRHSASASCPSLAAITISQEPPVTSCLSGRRAMPLSDSVLSSVECRCSQLSPMVKASMKGPLIKS